MTTPIHQLKLSREDMGYTLGVTLVLGLSALPGVGATVLRRLGDPTLALNAFEHEDPISFVESINSLGGRLPANLMNFDSWEAAKESILSAGQALVSELQNNHVFCITPASKNYPSVLNDLGDRKPNWLFLKGDLSLLDQPAVAVVGTRESSISGDFLTQYVVSLCAENGLTVISGLARGIDTTAHEWALKTGTPTISILGSGILRPYPAKNLTLSSKIVASGGLLISEYPPYQEPTADMFVWRNRLQACLSLHVIAPEWKKKSGTAHTIRFANELNRTTVSLNLVGDVLNGDEGIGSIHLELPGQHNELAELLEEASTVHSLSITKSQKEVNNFIQQDLF